MKQNEFIAWLEGFLYDKVKLGAADINLIQVKLEESTPQGHTVGYYPDPYSYPGMVGIESVKSANLNVNQDQLVQEMEDYAKDVDIVNIIEDGMLVCDAYGDNHFLDWDEVDAFIEERKMYDEGDC